MKSIAILFTLFLLMGNVHAQQGKTPAGMVDSNATLTAANTDTINYDRVFTKVDKPAEFPGGMKGWLNFLERNLDPIASEEVNLETGIYTVHAYFKVTKIGVVDDIKVIDNKNKWFTCIAYVKKLMKKSPKWIPAVVNGHDVNSWVNQVIIYEVIGM